MQLNMHVLSNFCQKLVLNWNTYENLYMYAQKLRVRILTKMSLFSVEIIAKELHFHLCRTTHNKTLSIPMCKAVILIYEVCLN